MLDAKHITVLLLTELGILFRLPFVSGEGFVLSTNSAITATFVSLILLLIWYTRQQMNASTATTVFVWEQTCAFRKFVLTVFCTNFEFAIRSVAVLAIFHFMCQKITHPHISNMSAWARSVEFAIPGIFSCLVFVRALLKFEVQCALVPLLTWIFLEKSSPISYMVDKLYTPWLLIAIN